MFSANLTFTIWAGLVIGGLGSKLGPILGAALLTAVSELVRLVEVAPEHANLVSAIHPLLVGVLLIAVLRWRPDGLLSERGTFTRLRGRQGGRHAAPVAQASTAGTSATAARLEGERA